jgi:hypothetical protein
MEALLEGWSVEDDWGSLGTSSQVPAGGNGENARAQVPDTSTMGEGRVAGNVLVLGADVKKRGNSLLASRRR